MKSLPIRNLAGLGALALLLGVAQVPGHSQTFTIYDGSYIEYNDYGEGYDYEEVVIEPDVECIGYCEWSDALGLPEWYGLPDGIVPEYTDCNCDTGGGYEVDPYWEFNTGGPFEWTDDVWEQDAEWTLYVADTTDAEPCTSGCCAADPDASAGYGYFDLYDDLEDQIFVDWF